MAILSFEDLKEGAQIYVQEWSTLSVNDEALMAADITGKKWVSKLDNWVLPDTSSFGIDPLIVIDNRVLMSSEYTLEAGDGIRGVITLETPVSVDKIVLASYRRSIFRNAYWERNIQQAADEIFRRLLLGHVDITTIDDENDPWSIIVKQGGLNAMINLQMLLAGFGRTQMEGMTVDLLRAAEMIQSGVVQMKEEIRQDIEAWRWQHTPRGRSVRPKSITGSLGVFGRIY